MPVLVELFRTVVKDLLLEGPLGCRMMLLVLMEILLVDSTDLVLVEPLAESEDGVDEFRALLIDLA